MSYYTKNEIQNFMFKQSQIFEIKEYRDQLIFDLGYVVIKAENSCNRDVFNMGTNELRVRLHEVSDIKITLLGYKVYNADGKLMKEVPDQVLEKEKKTEIFENLGGGQSQLLSVKHENDLYQFEAETEENLYLLEIKAGENSQEWEKFRRLPEE